MDEEEIDDSQDGSVQPTNEASLDDTSVTPAVEEDVEEDLSEYGVPPMTTEEKEGEVKEPVEPEKPEEKPEVEAPKPTPEVAPRETSGLDKRIAKIYSEVLLLQGKDAPDQAEVFAALKGLPTEERKAMLSKVLADRAILRGGRADAKVELSEEDTEALIEARVEEELEAMQEEIAAREWDEDLVKTVEAHPELNENEQAFNPQLAKAVENLAQRGMKVSEALNLLTSTKASIQGDEEREARKRSELKKQRALSGAVTATNDHAKRSKAMNWDEFDALRMTDPDRYEKLLDQGYEPED